jgi:hypothetical protein
MALRDLQHGLSWPGPSKRSPRNVLGAPGTTGRIPLPQLAVRKVRGSVLDRGPSRVLAIIEASSVVGRGPSTNKTLPELETCAAGM